MIYTNQTVEELEKYRCTSPGIFEALNSIWMKINYVVSFTIIIATFLMFIPALKVLKFHNVYSSGTQFLLSVILLVSCVNQVAFLEIKIRQLIQLLKFSDDPCKIEFHSSECYYDNAIHIFTFYLLMWLVWSLTLDRFLALFAGNLSDRQVISRRISYGFVVGALILTINGHLLVYSGVSRAGFVPNCMYPPQMALNSYQTANDIMITFILVNCFVTMLLFCFITYRDHRIRHKNYDTRIRYSSFENVITTKSILIITITQLFFSCIASLSVTIIRSFENGMSEYAFHIVVQYVSATLYGNFSIPCLIYLQTTQCIKRRRCKINALTSLTDKLDMRISHLKQTWEHGRRIH